jgi:hypothetical protein
MMSCLNHDYLILIFIPFHFMKIHRLFMLHIRKVRYDVYTCMISGVDFSSVCEFSTGLRDCSDCLWFAF